MVTLAQLQLSDEELVTWDRDIASICALQDPSTMMWTEKDADGSSIVLFRDHKVIGLAAFLPDEVGWRMYRKSLDGATWPPMFHHLVDLWRADQKQPIESRLGIKANMNEVSYGSS